MPTPTTPPRSRSSSRSKAAADAVGKAIGSIHPIVSMWRDGLTVIALESSLANRAPDYLTFDHATADSGLQVQEAAAQTVPSVDAITGPMPVLILGEPLEPTRHSSASMSDGSRALTRSSYAASIVIR